MTNTNLDCSQLELSKENIQPIRQGRKASALCNALDRDHQSKLQSERHEFEKEIRSYSGDDPLSVWYRYVLWVEQNFPSGGVQGNLFKLIESCFKTLCQNGEFDEKYKNDERLLDLWAKYATLSPCPLEIYQTLYSKNIFTEVAKFYEIWAWELEQRGNVKKANLIYLDGTGRKAKPVDSLEISYGKFLARIAQLTLEGMNSEDGENNENVQRQALSALKGKGSTSKTRAPTERISTIIGTAGKLSSAGTKTNNNMGLGFKIFQDENAPQDQVVENISGKRDYQFTSVSASNKENVKNASTWNKNKMKQKQVPTISVEDLSQVRTPSFTVHSDVVETNSQTVTTKVTEFSGVLSTRKCHEEWKVPLFVPDPFNPYAQPQYCKHRVYCGNEEFSFEELLALDRQKEEERKKEEGKKNSSLEDQVRDLQLKLQKQEEVIMSLIQSQNSSSNSTGEEIKSTPNEQEKKIEDHKEDCSESKKIYEDSFMYINKSVSFAANTTQNVGDENSTKALLELLPIIPNNTNNSLALPSQNSSSSSCSPSNNISASKEVTVNTKYAKNVVLKLFNATLSNNSATHEESLPIFCKENNSSPNGNVMVSSEPFQIYEDKIDLECPIPLSQNEQNSGLTSIPIYHDEKEQPMEVACGINEEKGCSAGFAIYSDEQPEFPVSNIEISSNNKPFSIHSDENNTCSAKRKQTPLNSFRKVLQPIVPDIIKDSPSKYSNDKENIMPSDYQEYKEKRPMAGILKPSLHVLSVPLEQQQEMEGVKNDDDERLDGIEPLPESNEEYFTMKVPLNSESFARNTFVASTPAPWSVSVVPQVKQGDDFTMALPQRRSILPEDEDTKAEDYLEEKPSRSKSELMPPPPNDETQSPNTSLSLSSESQTIRRPSQSVKYLSPILEASRETRSSSTSSSSGSYSTISTHSNICGISGHTTKSINFSQGKSFYGRKVNKYEEEENDYFNNSFDPNKIAAMLLSENPVTVYQKEEGPSEIVKDPQSSNKNDVKGITSSLIRTDISYPADIDPFSNDLRDLLLQNLKEPVADRAGFLPINNKMPLIKARSKISLGKEMYNVKRLIGSGAYAQVFHASTIDPMNVTVAAYENDDYDDDENEESQMIMKIQKPQCQWEFYICHELRERLKKIGASEKILSSFMRINRGYFFSQGSILVSQYHRNGTVIDLINKYKRTGKMLPEIVIIFILKEIILTLIYLHSCSIIHGDLKPDNVLIVDIPDTDSENSKDFLPVVKLIDFGRSIDMNLLPENTTFTKKVLTDGFSCVEMKENRPWTYQTDLYGLAAIAHCMIWGSYMNVKKEAGVWKVCGVNYQRYMSKEFWQDFFHKMLNIPSCSDIPDLKPVLQAFEEKVELFPSLGGIMQTFKGILKQ